jgi:hypothetical protein
VVAAADELYLMAHDLQSGKPRMSDQAMGGSLSAALLTELVLAGCIHVLAGGRLQLGEYGPPHEQLIEALYEQTRARLLTEELTVKDWLAEHGREAESSVAERLVRAGDLQLRSTRKLTRTVIRYHPVKPAEMFMRAQRLPSYLRHRVEVTEADVVVARLAQLMAPGRGVLELDDAAAEYLTQLLPALQPSLQELLAVVESLFGSGVRGPYF